MESFAKALTEYDRLSRLLNHPSDRSADFKREVGDFIKSADIDSIGLLCNIILAHGRSDSMAKRFLSELQMVDPQKALSVEKKYLPSALLRQQEQFGKVMASAQENFSYPNPV
jgi:hypothetical protein